MQYIETVAENRKNYTMEQFEDAKKARKLHHSIGPATVKNFKWILKFNQVKNCPVLAKHVDITEDICGPDLAY